MYQSNQLELGPINMLLGILKVLSNKRKLQLKILIILMFLSAFAEIFSLAALVPFLSVLTDPQKILNLPLIEPISILIGFDLSSHLLLATTLLFSFAVILSAFIRLSNLWLNARMASSIGTDISYLTYKNILNKSYSEQISINSSEWLNDITTHVDATVQTINQALLALTSIIMIIIIVLSFLIINWKLTFILITILSSIYFIIAFVSRKRLLECSSIIAKSSKEQIKLTQESLFSIRDIIINEAKYFYLSRYLMQDKPKRVNQADANFLGMFPKFSIEALALTLIIWLAFIQSQDDFLSIVPLLGILALGAQRLLPTLQQAYNSWAVIKSNSDSISNVYKLIRSKPELPYLIKNNDLFFNNNIVINNLTFKYSQELPNALSNINFKINKGERIAVIGTSGSGKSTLVDIIMSLLEPTSGEILVDSKRLFDRENPSFINSWRSIIGHVPQNIYLTDQTFAENIAFGIPYEEIDFERVKIAAVKAQIIEFILAKPYGFNTLVGEGGVRISGGQRQRIGIARALYKKAQILFFDEATSSLDLETERRVMESINKLSRNLTFIIIAHRLSTIKQCDRVLKLEKGKLISDSTPDHFLS